MAFTKEQMAEISKNTQFKAANKEHLKVDRKLEGMLKSKKFKEKCKDWLMQFGADALLQIAVGYKGVKPADRLAAIGMMAKVCGELKEQIQVERVDPVQDLSMEELEAMAKDALKELEQKKAEPVKVIDVDANVVVDDRGQGDTGGETKNSDVGVSKA